MPQERPWTYLQLSEQLRASIDAGTWQAGEKLPSLRAFARAHGVSTNTAVLAYRELESVGLIDGRSKSGFFVCGRTPRPTRPAPGRVAVTAQTLRTLACVDRPDLVPLGAAYPSPELYPAQALKRAYARVLRRHPELIGEYTHDAVGVAALRLWLAERYQRLGCNVGADDFIITHGATEALQLALGSLTQPGDTVAVESPAYYGFLQTLEGLGLMVLEVPSDPREGISIEALAEATRRAGAVRCVVLNPNFSNPTGAMMPPERKAALVRLAAERDFLLIEDDVYAELSHAHLRPIPLKAWDDGNRVVTCSSFSKTLAPGLRIGWLLQDRPEREAALRLKSQRNVATPLLPQAVLADYLASGDYEAHLRRLRDRFRRQLGRMADTIEAAFPPGTRVTRPEGGLLLWVELPPGADGDLLAEQALAEGIAIMPGSMFSCLGRYRGCVRINCGLPWNEQVGAAVARLGELIAAQLKGRIPT